MKLSPKLKAWIALHSDLDESASDADVKRAAGEAIEAGTLTPAKLFELSKTEDDEEASGFKGLLSELGTQLGDLKDILVADKATKKAATEETDEDEPSAKKGAKGKKPAFLEDKDDEEEEEEEEEKPKKAAKKATEKAKTEPSDLEKMVTRVSNPLAVADGEEKSLNVRVKEAAEGYSTTKSSMTYPALNGKGMPHPLAGRPVVDFTAAGAGGHPLDNASDLEKAVNGAYAKFEIHKSRTRSKTIAFATLPQHDRELLLYAMENMKWSGASDGGHFADIVDRKLTPREQKAIIDDSTSGGLEAAPISFDARVIEAPLLNGELFPLVNSIPIDRGRRIEGVATGTVTGSWGGVDDTAITLFATASYVSAFDTTIFRWEGAIRIGLDFLSDTPIDFGQHVTAQYGERLLEDLDDVISSGNGTTQPEGVFVKSGTTSVNFGSAAATLGGYESLRFGVAKPEHKSNLVSSAVFIGSEASYMRAKAIPVGSSDARRLSDTVNSPNYGNYSWMGVPYKINESGGNTKIAYCILGRYRMYRRRGLTMRTSQEGDTLIRNNEMLIAVTARYGGHLERGACAAVTTSAQA